MQSVAFYSIYPAVTYNIAEEDLLSTTAGARIQNALQYRHCLSANVVAEIFVPARQYIVAKPLDTHQENMIWKKSNESFTQ